MSANVAMRVLNHPSSSGRVFVTRGDIFPDALAVSPLAWRHGAPVLLTRPASLPASVGAVLKDPKVSVSVIVGGTASVSSRVSEEVGVATGSRPERIAGPNRYATSVALAKWACREGLAVPDHVGLVTGSTFPDALAGGVAVGDSGGVMLLTEPRRLTPVASDWLRKNRSDETRLVLFGGAASVSEPVEATADRIVTFSR